MTKMCNNSAVFVLQKNTNPIIGVARNFFGGLAKPQVTENDVIRKF